MCPEKALVFQTKWCYNYLTYGVKPWENERSEVSVSGLEKDCVAGFHGTFVPGADRLRLRAN